MTFKTFLTLSTYFDDFGFKDIFKKISVEATTSLLYGNTYSLFIYKTTQFPSSSRKQLYTLFVLDTFQTTNFNYFYLNEKVLQNMSWRRL